MSASTDIIAELCSLLPANELFAGSDVPPRAANDMSGMEGNLPLALVRPSSVEHLSEALKTCHDAGQSIVPQGGLSGLSGGAVPNADDIALSLESFTGIEEIDPVAGTMLVRAGTILETAQEAAAEHGMYIPVDLGARGSATIGGMIATNAGGIRVLRHGMMRANVLALEAVLADGTILSNMRPFLKNNTGYDLKQMFIGSEGTLGVITRAVLNLEPLPANRQTALCSFDRYEDVVAFLTLARSKLTGLSAFEVMWGSYVDYNQRVEGLKFFDQVPLFAVIIENETITTELDDSFEEFLGSALESGILSDGLIAQSEREAQSFWAIREGYKMFELIPHLINYDVSIPIDQMNTYVDRLTDAIKKHFPNFKAYFFGHLADCNLHIAIDCDIFDENISAEVARLTYDLVEELEGSVSAEHGIGVLKRKYLHQTRSTIEINLMKSFKRTLDPTGILNPGKVL